MSGVPNQEPSAYGLITFKTTFGTIDIELFTKQCPKATRNFVQLCMDNYYKGTSFERVEKNFIAIGGASSRTNLEALESSFADEFHSRLKFTRRGLLATANEGKDENGPKFFFTLGATPELQNKHTIFGRAKGESVYTLVELNECQVDEHFRPYSEQKIEEVIVIDNPFQELTSRLKSLQTEIQESDSSSSEEYYDPLSKPKQDLTKVKKLSFHYDEDDDSESANEEPNSCKVPPLPGHNPENKLGDIESNSQLLDRFDNTNSLDNSEDGTTDVPARTDNMSDDKERRVLDLKRQFEAVKTLVENYKDEDKQPDKNELSLKANIPSLDDEAHLSITTKKGRDRQLETIELVTNFKKKLKQVSTTHKNLQPLKQDREKIESDEIDELDQVDGDEWLNHRFEPEEDAVDYDGHNLKNYELHEQSSSSRHRRPDYGRQGRHHRNHDHSTRGTKPSRY